MLQTLGPVHIIGVLWLVSFFPLSAYFYLSGLGRSKEERDAESKPADSKPADSFIPQLRWDFYLPAFLSSGFTLLGFLVLFSSPILGRNLLALSSDLAQQATQYGFLFAYLISIVIIYRSYQSGVLRPEVYYRCNVILLTGFFLNLVVFEVVHRVMG